MLTIKLPISLNVSDQMIVADLQRQQSCVIRSAYSLFQKGNNEKEIRAKLKHMNNVDLIGSWFQQSAIKDAYYMYLADKELEVKTRIFGGKNNLKNRSQNKISKIDWKQNRLLPITSIGTASYYGNMKFAFDVIDNNQIILKINRHQHIQITLPKLRKKYKDTLYQLELLTNDKKLPISFKLTTTHIFITYDENRLEREVQQNKKIVDRVLGIDMNPNYIGTSIQQNNIILSTKFYDLSKLTIKSKEPSDSKISKHLDNKLDHETVHIAKDIINYARSNNVSIIAIESLGFKPGNSDKGRGFNRLTQNKWKKNLFTRVLVKYAALYKIKIKYIVAAYSSTVGNLLNPQYPDPIASSIEIGRRATGSFYPVLITNEVLSNRWKEATEWMYKDWKELHVVLKNLKVRYRVPISPDIVFRLLYSKNSNTYYSII